MNMRGESGFSLIELLLVVVIIGVIAAMAIPAYQKGMWAAENGAAFSTLRTISSTQLSFYTQNSRYGRLDEINRILGGGVGTVVGDRLVRGKYVFEMTPIRPSDGDLAGEFLITATRDISGDAVYKYELNQTGKIIQVYPVGAPEN
ncbi:MAG TPA: prepilin-type N-terminal cleavage/methylation domain-containing protein [Pyrinomonadaceae bacterium]|nr:prepilin-type N-terminal cleavage/methylation domain-containing protein [Pyrinomonadaceae bacterium]